MNRGFRRPGFFLIALLCLFVAMEEISWGQRVFAFKVPEIYQRLNLQGEMTIHNLFDPDEYYYYIRWILILGGIVLPILTGLSKRVYRFCEHFGIPIVTVHQWPFIVLPIYFLEYSYSHFKLSVTHELMEFSMGIAVLIVIKDLAFKSKLRGSTGKLILSNLVTIFIVCICTAPLIFAFRPDHAVQFRLNRNASFCYPRHGMYRQALILFEYMDRHPQYREKGFLYDYGLVLLKLSRVREAKNIFEKALQENATQCLENREDPKNYRIEGKILHALGRIGAAQKAYHKSIALDHQLLKKANDIEVEARARWSLGKTLFAMGQKEAAEAQFECLRQMTSARELHWRVAEWIAIKRRVKQWKPADMPRIQVEVPLLLCRRDA